MATQILGREAAHRQLLAKGRHAARKEGHWAGPGSQVPGTRIPAPLKNEAAAAPLGRGAGGSGNVSCQEA